MTRKIVSWHESSGFAKVVQQIKGEMTDRPYRIIRWRGLPQDPLAVFYCVEALCDDGSWCDVGREYDSLDEALKACSKIDLTSALERDEIKAGVR